MPTAAKRTEDRAKGGGMDGGNRDQSMGAERERWIREEKVGTG